MEGWSCHQLIREGHRKADLLDPATPEDVLDLSRREGKYKAQGDQQVKKAEEEPGRAPSGCGLVSSKLGARSVM